MLAAAAERSGKVEQEKNNSSKDDVITELREKNKALSSEREKYFAKFSSAQGKLKRVERQLVSLTDAHDEEVKATKHVAHVKIWSD